MSFFSWFTTCIDVGPEGFTTPKRPDRGNEGDLGMIAGYESSREKLSDLLRGKSDGDIYITVYCKSIYKLCAGLPDPKRRSNCTFNLTTPNILLSSMAAAKDVEHQKMFSNSCVNGQ